MSLTPPTPTGRSSSAVQSEINARFAEDLRALEARQRTLDERVRALEERVKVDEARMEGARLVHEMEDRQREARVGALEAWRRGEEVSKGGIAFGILKGGLPVAISLAALLFAVLSKAGC